jgi:hypothetical protein
MEISLADVKAETSSIDPHVLTTRCLETWRRTSRNTGRSQPVDAASVGAKSRSIKSSQAEGWKRAKACSRQPKFIPRRISEHWPTSEDLSKVGVTI